MFILCEVMQDYVKGTGRSGNLLSFVTLTEMCFLCQKYCRVKFSSDLWLTCFNAFCKTKVALNVTLAKFGSVLQRLVVRFVFKR